MSGQIGNSNPGEGKKESWYAELHTARRELFVELCFQNTKSVCVCIGIFGNYGTCMGWNCLACSGFLLSCLSQSFLLLKTIIVKLKRVEWNGHSSNACRRAPDRKRPKGKSAKDLARAPKLQARMNTSREEGMQQRIEYGFGYDMLRQMGW